MYQDTFLVIHVTSDWQKEFGQGLWSQINNILSITQKATNSKYVSSSKYLKTGDVIFLIYIKCVRNCENIYLKSNIAFRKLAII